MRIGAGIHSIGSRSTTDPGRRRSTAHVTRASSQQGELPRSGQVPATIVAMLLASGGFTAGQVRADDVGELREQLQAHEQKIRVLERKLELQDEATQASSATAAAVRASPKDGFRIESADGANVARLRGLLHFDGRYFPDDVTTANADTWLLRRVRPTLEGTLDGIFDYRFTPDLAGGKTIILDAFLAARLAPGAVITAGKFKVPVGLERLASASDLRFIERGLPTSLLPNRDLGVQLSGELRGGLVSYSVGYFNGVNDGGSSDANSPTPDADNDSRGDWAARVWFQLFASSDSVALRGLGFGIAGTYVNSTGSPATTRLPSYRTPGQQTFFSYRGATPASATAPAIGGTYADGERLRWTPQLYYSIGSFGLLGEYAQVSQEVSRETGNGLRSAGLDHEAWQLQLAWFVTGEEQAFKGYKPASMFSPGEGTWGGVELVARYHVLDIDDDAFAGGADSFADPATAASKASAWGIGINWYPTRNYKWSLNYDVTRFEGGAADGRNRPEERALFTRFGVSF